MVEVLQYQAQAPPIRLSNRRRKRPGQSRVALPDVKESRQVCARPGCRLELRLTRVAQAMTFQHGRKMCPLDNRSPAKLWSRT